MQWQGPINMKKTNKKFKINKKAVIIAGIILFCLAVPMFSMAADATSVIGTVLGGGASSLLFPNLIGNIGKDILVTLMNGVQTVLNWLIQAGAGLFEAVINIGFDNDVIQGIKTGWKTVRDVANMFFILFMVIVAFGTILRLNEYGVKKLLPKIIIVALLINFSLVLCSIVVDFSNITADFFIKDIKGKISGEKNSISATFAEAMDIAGIYKTFTNCEDYGNAVGEDCAKFSLSPTKIFRSPYDCLGLRQSAIEDCNKKGVGKLRLQADLSDVNFLDIFLGITVGSIVMLIAAFVLFAGAIMLLIRIIAIWILIVISPLALVCLVLPALHNHWAKWRGTFLKWCFFGPIYSFFIWMATRIAIEKIGEQMGQQVSKYTKITGEFNYFANKFISNPGGQLVRYFVISGFLIGGLIAAQQLSIYGAKAAISIGQKWGKGARDWATRTTMKPFTLAGAGALGLTGKLFGGKLGGRMQAKSLQMKRAMAQTKENKAYEQLLNTMTDEQRLNEVKTALGARKLLAVQKAQAIGLLQKTEDRDAVRTGIDILRGYGFGKEAGDLEEARFSAIKDKTKRKEIARKVKAKNIHKELKPVVFKGAAGYEAAADFASLEPTVSAAIETAKQMRTDTQKEYARGLLASFINNNNFTDKENIKLRSIYAALTGALHHAFRDGQTGLPNTAALETFVKSMKPRDFTEIDPHSIPYIAEFVETTTANDVGRIISTATKQAFIRKWQALAMDPKTHAKFDGLLTDLKKNPNWKSLIL